MSNEVFVGANAQVGLCPELDMFFNNVTINGSQQVTVSDGNTFKLVTNIYTGCTAKVVNSGTTTYHAILSAQQARCQRSRNTRRASHARLSGRGRGHLGERVARRG